MQPAPYSQDAAALHLAQQAPVPAPVIPRRDKSLSALSHELIARYGNDGTIIDLDDVQVRLLTATDIAAPTRSQR